MTQRFELTPRGQIHSDAELLADLKRVARQLGVSKLGRKQYTATGRFNGDNIAKRFGGWKNALGQAGLASPQQASASEQELLQDLRRAASELGASTLSFEQYKSVGGFSEHPFRKRFGSWSESVRRAGLAAPAGYRARVSDEDYFQNLEQIWTGLGRQPRYTEILKPLSKYSVKAYEHRFGSWRKALEAFVEFVNREEGAESLALARAQAVSGPDRSDESRQHRTRVPRRTKRAPSHRLRFLVMRRDSFKCRICGRHPASDQTIILHVDHVVPWDVGGETVLANLQTLCETCNLGKSNLAL